jgi:tetratricopeptide (TPR) repeat protein
MLRPGNLGRNRGLVAGMFGALAIAAIPANGQGTMSSQCPAECELHLGMEAFRMAQYQEAIPHLQRATELDPDLPMAREYLGSALAENVIPALDTPENLKLAQQALDVFQQVLKENSHDVKAMKQIAGVYFNVKKLDDARAWQMKVLDEDPSDAEAAYTIGMIDWTEAHENAVRALAAVGMLDDGEGNVTAPPALLEAIRKQDKELVDEALKYLTQALANRPDYDDAMAYMNLVYRRKADLDWNHKAMREDDLTQAREWTHRSVETRRAKEEKKLDRTQP